MVIIFTTQAIISQYQTSFRVLPFPFQVVNLLVTFTSESPLLKANLNLNHLKAEHFECTVYFRNIPYSTFIRNSKDLKSLHKEKCYHCCLNTILEVTQIHITGPSQGTHKQTLHATMQTLQSPST